MVLEFDYSTVESLMEALESQLGEGQGSGKGSYKSRERQLDEEFESMFKTKINEEHLVGKYKKMFKVEEHLREASFYYALQQHADTEMMRA
jgi:hypothetical protein